jgi:hypothetical protein
MKIRTRRGNESGCWRKDSLDAASTMSTPPVTANQKIIQLTVDGGTVTFM